MQARTHQETSQALVVSNEGAALIPAGLVASAREYVKHAKADATRKAYAGDWQAFVAWCDSKGLEALPASPDTVACYVAALADAGRKYAGIARTLTGISQAHKHAGLLSPRGAAQVQAAMQGIRRTLGVAQVQKSPILAGELRAMVSAMPVSLKGARDRALLLLGFAGAFRRSELAGLNVSDLAFGADGLTVTLRRSKTDQEGAGRKVGVPFGSEPTTCPVRTLKAWLESSGVVAGALFVGMTRHGHLTGKRLLGCDIARVVKVAASAIGLDASGFSGHSLRAGLATSAAKAGKSERAIMNQTGHRSVTMVRRYIRDASLFTDNACAGLL